MLHDTKTFTFLFWGTYIYFKIWKFQRSMPWFCQIIFMIWHRAVDTQNKLIFKCSVISLILFVCKLYARLSYCITYCRIIMPFFWTFLNDDIHFVCTNIEIIKFSSSEVILQKIASNNVSIGIKISTFLMRAMDDGPILLCLMCYLL